MLHRNTNRAVCWKDGMYKQCENRFLFQITVVVAVLLLLNRIGWRCILYSESVLLYDYDYEYVLTTILWYLVGSNFDKESTYNLENFPGTFFGEKFLVNHPSMKYVSLYQNIYISLH